MWQKVLQVLLMAWGLGCGATAWADSSEYRFQAVGTGLWTLRTDAQRGEAPAAKATLPADIDSILKVGQVLYVVYAKQYIAVFDISVPTRPALRETLSAGVDVERLYLGAGGDKTLLLVTGGAAAAYSLADPMHPAPILGSIPLLPISAQQEKDEMTKLAARKYRDYGSVHPSIAAGGIIALIGALMMSGSVPFLVNSAPNEKDFTPIITYPVAVSGGLHVLIGGGFLISGIYRQHTDKRLRRPAK